LILKGGRENDVSSISPPREKQTKVDYVMIERKKKTTAAITIDRLRTVHHFSLAAHRMAPLNKTFVETLYQRSSAREYPRTL
jgi:hypothetical protein